MSEPLTVSYREYRCGTCQKLLFKGVLIDSEVEIKCKRCDTLNVFQGEPASKYICLKECPNRVSVKTTD